MMADSEVITLGETMLRLTPPGFQRLEQATGFELHVGGSESNTAVGLARLGRKVIWISRLPASPLGRLVSEAIGRFSVDVDHVVWSDSDRLGTYYLERGKSPRASQVLYDRRDSAMSRMQPDDLPTELFRVGKAKIFHTTGITLGISDSAAQTACVAAELARAAQMLVSFDVNYRAKLWSPQSAQSRCSEFMQLADILFLPIRDARTLWGIEETADEEVLKSLSQRFPQRIVVMTLGDRGAIAIDRNGQLYRQSAFPTSEVERLGTGDAFSAGFLASYLEHHDIPLALRWACASASLKYTIAGDFPLFTYEEVASLANEDRRAGGLVR